MKTKGAGPRNRYLLGKTHFHTTGSEEQAVELQKEVYFLGISWKNEYPINFSNPYVHSTFLSSASVTTQQQQRQKRKCHSPWALLEDPEQFQDEHSPMMG